ncbi:MULTISPECIES: cytochrome c oxidase assembly protein [unclassified Streptomyces]|uniref:cytochrome c oxidase assembly protein n=1 Tax=unclassified Streptomyces TaxID=2593676 RepID=UPI003655BAC5
MHHVHAHGRGGGGGAWEVPLPLAAVLLLAGTYLLLTHWAHGRNPIHGWRRWRTVSFLTGCALLGVALFPPLSTFAHGDFRGHMAQHLLIGMYAPLCLVLGAPVTLLLRTLPTVRARRLTGLLRSRPVHMVRHPVSALVLSTGTLAVLYFTPLYNATMDRPDLHWLMHTHFLLSGCLFAYVIASPEPAPVQPSVPTRLVTLGVAIATHATISQLMYGGFLIDVHAPISQVQGGAEIMYYGGDIAELLLAAALVATWRPSRHRSTEANAGLRRSPRAQPLAGTARPPAPGRHT